MNDRKEYAKLDNQREIVVKFFIIVAFLTNIPLFLNAQIIANFETTESTPTLTADGNTDVTDNPHKSGINTSNKVAYYKKIEGNWRYVTLNFGKSVDIGYNNTLKFKVYASQKGRVFAKFWNGNEVLTEDWAPTWEFMPESNIWTECVMDLTEGMQQSFTSLQLAMCVDNNAEADVYFDDIELTNPDLINGYPKALFTVSETKINAGESINFDASASYDYDGEITSYNWYFGDGNSASGKTINYTYSNAGSYWMKLQLTDNDGKTTTDSTAIFVFSENEKMSSLLWTVNDININEKAEAIFQIKKEYLNTYDPDEIQVDAKITFPEKDPITLPCFYYVKSYLSNTEWLIDDSYQGWMLRFSSPVEGAVEIQIEIKDSEGSYTSPSESIVIGSGYSEGIIGPNPENDQYYQHANGTNFYPLGINIGWNDIANYSAIIKNLGKYDANIFRYWHTPFAKQALEWKNNGFYKGLGKYNQQAAAMTDSLINLGLETNVYMQLVIFQHGMFSENVNEMWIDNPYNTANGGFVSKAEEYFYNEECKMQTKKLLRYIVARWAYSQQIFAWEFFNEVQFTGVYNAQSNLWYPGVQQWHSEMSRYIETIDPYNHIMTTSAADNMLPDFDTISALDNLQYHLYSNNILEHQKELDIEFKEGLNKSIINGEYGFKDDADMTFEGQRHSIWNGIMTQVPRFMWIWGHYLAEEWAQLFELPASFMEIEKIEAKKELKSFDFEIDADQNFEKSSIANDSFFAAYIYTPNISTTIDGAELLLTNIPYGFYDVSFYLPTENRLETQKQVPFIELTNKITLPNFASGMAFSIKNKKEYNLPIAIAGNDTSTAPGTTLTFNGERSVSPEGTALNYQWTILQKPAGSNSIIDNEGNKIIEFTPDVSGIYLLSLTVYDGTNYSVPDELSVLVSNRAIAVAGNDTTIEKTGRYFYLDGAKSYDPDGDALSFDWKLVEKPVGSGASLLQFDQANAILKFDVQGIYRCALTVSDGISSSEPDTIKITIVPEGGNAIHTATSEYDIKVYPNPAQNFVYIESEEAMIRIIMYDIHGRMLKEMKCENPRWMKINLTKSTRQNIIFLKIETTSGISIKKLILDSFKN